MLETTRLLTIERYRVFSAKLRASPFLYLFFTLMVIVSLASFAVLTVAMVRMELPLTVSNVFFFVFTAFLLKAAADIHRSYVMARTLSYTLTTPTSHRMTLGNVMASTVLLNLGIWLTFSLLFLVFLQLFHFPLWYPLEYLMFTGGVALASGLGCVLAVHFFSPAPYRLAPTLLLLGAYGLVQLPEFVVLTAPLVAVHVWWALRHAIASYGYVKRKARTADAAGARPHGVVVSLFYREVTVLWRERLFASFVFMSVSTALGTGYLYLNGARLFVPPAILHVVGDFLPSLFVFLGVYVVVLYTAVFPALSLFLNEERTMWILRTLPLSTDVIIAGKVAALGLCFVAALPFLAFITVFVGAAQLPFITWLLVFSFIIGISIAIPLGVKYVGKKSDLLLLYSVSLALFVVLNLIVSFIGLQQATGAPLVFVYIGLLAAAVGGLVVSLKVSGWMLAQQHPEAIIHRGD